MKAAPAGPPDLEVPVTDHTALAMPRRAGNLGAAATTLMNPIQHIIPELRDAIGPVILISGVGLLLLTMTNRLGRAIDRARQLKNELAARNGHAREQTLAQVAVLYRRAGIIRLSIILAASSAALAAGLMVVLFLNGLLQTSLDLLIGVLFIACLGALLGSLVAFICDINLSLQALKLELEDLIQPAKPPTEPAADI